MKGFDCIGNYSMAITAFIVNSWTFWMGYLTSPHWPVVFLSASPPRMTHCFPQFQSVSLKDSFHKQKSPKRFPILENLEPLYLKSTRMDRQNVLGMITPALGNNVKLV